MARKKTTEKVVKQKESVFDDEPPLEPIVEEDSPLVEDLSEEEKAKFSRLLKEKMTVERRAELLIELANLTDRHGAPVALRAIEQINKITGVTTEKAVQAAPLFITPKDAKIAIGITESDE